MREAAEMSSRRGGATAYVITGLLVVLLLVAAVGILRLGQGASGGSGSGGDKATLVPYYVYPNGTKIQLNTGAPSQSIVCAPGVTCNLSGGSFQWAPAMSVSFQGDTVSSGSCSGTVSYHNSGTVLVSSASTSGLISATSSSPASTSMSAVTVSSSLFSAEGSGTYTLTATLSGSCTVTFSAGNSGSGSATSAGASISYTVQSGTVTGVTASA